MAAKLLHAHCSGSARPGRLGELSRDGEAPLRWRLVAEPIDRDDVRAAAAPARTAAAKPAEPQRWTAYRIVGVMGPGTSISAGTVRLGGSGLGNSADGMDRDRAHAGSGLPRWSPGRFHPCHRPLPLQGSRCGLTFDRGTAASAGRPPVLAASVWPQTSARPAFCRAEHPAGAAAAFVGGPTKSRSSGPAGSIRASAGKDPLWWPRKS